MDDYADVIWIVEGFGVVLGVRLLIVAVVLKIAAPATIPPTVDAAPAA
jgi:hypothetical protein